MPAPRVVLDTNVLVSALLGKGTPAQLYEAFKRGEFWLVLSNRLIAELADVLLRPKLRISSEDVRTAFHLLRTQALVTKPKQQVNICRDPKDNIILECALAGDAAWIVTGDRDLLALNPFQEIRIVPPSMFLKHLPK